MYLLHSESEHKNDDADAHGGKLEYELLGDFNDLAVLCYLKEA